VRAQFVLIGLAALLASAPAWAQDADVAKLTSALLDGDRASVSALSSGGVFYVGQGYVQPEVAIAALNGCAVESTEFVAPRATIKFTCKAQHAADPCMAGYRVDFHTGMRTLTLVQQRRYEPATCQFEPVAPPPVPNGN
jgi:hypothetical protein